MPAHLHPAPGCSTHIGHPCGTTTCSHAACLNGGRLLACEPTKDGQYYCFHAEYLVGALPESFNPDLLKPISSPALSTAAAVKPPLTGVAAVAARYKGTYDLAGAAYALWLQDPGFICDQNATEFARVTSQAEFFKVRHMNCFEFVHFAAYLAGSQRVTPSGGNAMVDGQVNSVYTQSSYAVWPPRWARHLDVGPIPPGSARAILSGGDGALIPISFPPIPRGLVIVGVAPVWNNNAGYYHVAISLGGGQIISLSSNGNLHINSISDEFGRWYKEVRFSNYNWRLAQQDYGAPVWYTFPAQR